MIYYNKDKTLSNSPGAFCDPYSKRNFRTSRNDHPPPKLPADLSQREFKNLYFHIFINYSPDKESGKGGIPAKVAIILSFIIDLKNDSLHKISHLTV
jgi:hypothetical protein